MLFYFKTVQLTVISNFLIILITKKHIAYCFAHHTGKSGYYAIQQERI